jgi:aldehyde:ferredoxin oxidoreductase
MIIARSQSTNVCFVDLDRGEFRVDETPEDVVRRFLGSRGLNMYYLHKYLEPGIDGLSPENVLIVGTGLLTGSGLPNTGRFNVTAKSPESRVLGDSSCGGSFGPEMRFAGIDRLVITGRASEPSILAIEDGEIEIRPAEKYWGLDTNDAQSAIRADFGRNVEVLCIGRAGENGVRYACLRTGIKNAAGRTGLGAVMGSKNIKAIIARGNRGVPIADTTGFARLVVDLRDYLQSSKVIQVLGRVGTPLLYDVSNYLGAIRTKNSIENQFTETLNAEEIHEYVEKMLSCWGCVVHCRHRNTVKPVGEGPEYTSVALLGANVGIDDPEKVIELQNICNDVGLDVSSTSTMIAWAIEASREGILPADKNNGPLEFGDYDRIKALIYQIVNREGLGDLLAEGTRIVQQFGERANRFMIAIKGLPQSDPHDVRYLKSFSLGIATSSRGADHLRSRPTLEIFNLPSKLLKEIYGSKIDSDPTSYETKEKMVCFHENIYAVVDSLGICKFVCHGFNSPKLLGYEHFSRMISTAKGWRIDREELEDCGRRIIDLERLINIREGITRKDDTLPDRYFDDPMPKGMSAGHRIDREKFGEMLDRYYALRGWTKEGLVPQERAREIAGEE